MLSSNTVIHTGAERVYFVPDGVVTICSMAFIRILFENLELSGNCRNYATMK